MSCFHRGPYIQRGRGVGSALNSMFKSVVPAMQVLGKKISASPIAQDVLSTGKQSAIKAGKNVVSDVTHGKKLGESIAENVTTAKKAVTESLLSALDKAKVSGVGTSRTEQTTVGNLGVKRKRAALTSSVGQKAKRQKHYGDIFEENFV